MDNNGTSVALNSLVEINLDRIEGYVTASNETLDEDLKILFKRFIDNSNVFNKFLKEQIALIGEVSIIDTSTLGKFYRAWMDIKTTLTTNDRLSILELCVYGEELAMEAYNNALSRDLDNLNEQLKFEIENQREVLKKDEKLIKDLIADLESKKEKLSF